MTIPSATYRLQFSRDFTFAQARGILPYLHALGISHIYASPYFQASPESMHGYDVTDHNAFNPAVGSRADYDAFAAELKRLGLGQIVDFVPNHMGIGPLNRYWMDVLEHGQGSAYARFFDIDWRPLKEELEGKVLLPILGDQYGRVLEQGDLKLNFGQGAFFLTYFQARLPIDPRSYGEVLDRALQLSGLPPDDAPRIELQSIVTATEHLPPRTEASPEKIAERAREKEAIKLRLERLCSENPAVEKAVADAVDAFNGSVGDRHSFDPLDRLIGAQAYRLSFWRVAAEEINYRRFFDINGLAAIRMELPEVFEAAHRLLLELIAEGSVTGLRIDHVDGLWNPREYLEQLQRRCREAAGLGENFYLIAEKILLSGETLRPDWPVHGTTGYDFTNQIAEMLVDKSAEPSLTETYRRFVEKAPRYSDLVYQNKKLVMELSLASEVNVLAHILSRLSEDNRWYRDFTLNALTAAVREVIACFPVYRTYAEPERELSDSDKQAIDRAVRAARRRNPGMEASIFNFLREILLLRFPENIGEEERAEHFRFVLKFQQCTGPVAAKGVEDTAFYIYNRLAALNEVGGEPDRLGAAPETLHRQNAARLEGFPHAMLATSTHDTKRSEDVRARLAAISEIPEAWRRAVQRFRTANRKHKSGIDGEAAPDANEEYLIYQTLAGVWPLAGGAQDETFAARIEDYMAKAIKEAKVNSSWIQPNEHWDEAVRKFIAAILKPGRGNKFPSQFQPVAEDLARLGAVNSLSQALVKFTAPGVPDIYQGNEMWDFSLVDPDNRRPVDFAARRKALKKIERASPEELLANWQDGRIKLFLTAKLLRFRREHFDLFARGDYLPVAATGAFSESCFAFLRRHGGMTFLAIAPRLSSKVGFPPIGNAWRDTALDYVPERAMRDLFTGREYSSRLAECFGTLPFAVFVNGS